MAVADITRDDLRVLKPNHLSCTVHISNHVEVTDEEFDRLAREAGYVRVVAEPDNRRVIGRMLRALLTDECDRCHGNGRECWSCVTGQNPTHTDHGDQPCPDCGGRGWLPKDGVSLQAATWLAIPLDWLEAEDD